MYQSLRLYKLKNLTKHIILKDKRKLCFMEYGSPDGYPIIYCHGSQSSRLEMHYDLSFALEKHLKIICIDRPGHGESDYNPKGTILSFAKDVMQLVEQLGIEKFSLAGMSAGAPFALSLAYLFPARIKSVAIISGFAPYNNESKKHLSKEVRIMLNLAKTFPSLLKFLLCIQSRQLKNNTKKALSGFLKIMSNPDQKVLENPAVMHVIEGMFIEAFKNGYKGVAHEISKLLVNDWGFDLEEIAVPISFWQGGLDNNVPYKWAERMHKAVANSSLKIYPKEGHLIIFDHAEEIFTSLKIS